MKTRSLWSILVPGGLLLFLVVGACGKEGGDSTDDTKATGGAAGTGTRTGSPTGTPTAAPTGTPSGTATPSGTSSGTPSGAPTDPLNSVFANNGYGENGTWRGHLTTTVAGGAEITPVCNEAGTAACFYEAEKRVCVTGGVPGTVQFSAEAAVGWHLNQEMNPPNPPGVWAVSGNGVSVQLKKKGVGELRVQVRQSNPTTTWCAILPDSGSGVIPWTKFNTKCWDDSGLPLPVGTRIQDIAIAAPGGGPGESPNRFDFCIIDLAPVP